MNINHLFIVHLIISLLALGTFIAQLIRTQNQLYIGLITSIITIWLKPPRVRKKNFIKKEDKSTNTEYHLC